MDVDEVTKTHESATDTWLGQLAEYGVSGIEKLASQYRNGDSCTCIAKMHGSFNMCFKVLFNDGKQWAVRFPIPGKVMHTEEKIRREVAVMKFLKAKTAILVPAVIAFGMAVDNHDPNIGPFIITDWIEGVSLSSVMGAAASTGLGSSCRLYTNDDGTISWPVTSRPLTLKMNEIESDGYVIVDDLALAPFKSASEYIDNLIQQNIKRLKDQRNSVDDINDARSKYVLRQRVKAIAPQFVAKDYDAGPFKLRCDDFRPGNILVNENTLQITAVIDWEWTYAAPCQVLFSPPSWLILERPTSWTDSSTALYLSKLQIFLKSLEDEEVDRELKQGIKVLPDRRMSALMRQSIEDGKFWFNELIHESFNFDEEILWPRIEELLISKGLAEVGVPTASEVEDFAAMKDRELQQYKQDLQALQNESISGQTILLENSGEEGLLQ